MYHDTSYQFKFKNSKETEGEIFPSHKLLILSLPFPFSKTAQGDHGEKELETLRACNRIAYLSDS